MLFSGKENVFMCLSATKFVLRKINFGVWFIQTFLQKMLYMSNFPHTSSTVIMQIMNQFHTHSQKKQNPVKKFIKSGQIEMHGGGEDEIARWRRDRRRDWCDRSTSGAIDNRDRRVVRSPAKSLLPLSLSNMGSLSLSLSLSLQKWFELKIRV